LHPNTVTKDMRGELSHGEKEILRFGMNVKADPYKIILPIKILRRKGGDAALESFINLSRKRCVT